MHAWTGSTSIVMTRAAAGPPPWRCICTASLDAEYPTKVPHSTATSKSFHTREVKECSKTSAFAPPATFSQCSRLWAKVSRRRAKWTALPGMVGTAHGKRSSTNSIRLPSFCQWLPEAGCIHFCRAVYRYAYFASSGLFRPTFFMSHSLESNTIQSGISEVAAHFDITFLRAPLRQEGSMRDSQRRSCSSRRPSASRRRTSTAADTPLRSTFCCSHPMNTELSGVLCPVAHIDHRSECAPGEVIWSRCPSTVSMTSVRSA
mmetsp:Transcript_72066/g.191506  ORF Transcript_72066/g.191506 Transcript_72066/m.191506 type:complete len:260 (-) Transcript_72066:9-788(-)